MNAQLFATTLGRRIIRYKLKTFIMMLGITIGVFALIVGISLGITTEKVILDFFNKTFVPNSVEITQNYSALAKNPLTTDDMQAILNEIPGISAATPIVRVRSPSISHQGNQIVTSLMGMDLSAQQVMGQSVETGSYFSSADVSNRQRVAVIGNTVANTLFADQSPVGQSLSINNSVYTIVGVMKELGANPHGDDLDNIIVIPYTTMLRISKNNYLNSIRVLANSPAAVDAMVEPIATVLRREHTINVNQEDDFRISTSPRGQDMFEQLKATFLLLLPLTVAVIFLISAITISVIMLISIRERCAEIGLRKAVGAMPRDLRLHFLIESILITVLGAIAGCALALLSFPFLSKLVSKFTGGDWVLNTSINTLLLSLCCAVLVGVVAAYYPANKAAKTVPVEALRI